MRVLIKTDGSFKLKDETILKCIESGLGKFFFKWDVHRHDQQYGIEYKYLKELRCNQTFIEIITELDDDAFVEGSECCVAVIDIPFDSLDGWHVSEASCSNSEFISEDHRCWWESGDGGTVEHLSTN